MNTHGVLKNNSNGLGMLMLGMQVDGLRKHPNGRVDQLEDRYLGMVEAPSSNLGTSTRNDSKQHCWSFSHKRDTNKRFFCWLGTSTLNGI